MLYQWSILNLMRGILAMLGWFVVSLRPSTDRLMKSLTKADENFLGPDRMGADQHQLAETIGSTGA